MPDLEATPDEPGARDPRAADPGSPDRPGTDQPGTGRERLAGSMLHPSRSQIAVGILLAALGFAAVTQVRTNELDDTYASYREQDLIDVLSTLTDAAQRAQSELGRLESTRRDLLDENQRRKAAVAQAEQAAQALEVLAGQVPVSGPGVQITITEQDGTVEIGTLLDTVQELRTAGAEAMEFNNEIRIVAQSAFTDGAGGIVVDGILLSSPYTLEVIGEPRTLEGGMSFLRGPTDQLEENGAQVRVDPLQTVVIDSVRPATQPEYAQPDTGQ